MNIFEQASRTKLRFETDKGLLSTENLWDLSLTALNKIAVGIHNNLPNTEQVSFLKGAVKNPTHQADELRLEILKAIIADIEDRIEKREQQLVRADKIRQIEEVLERRKGEELANTSTEDLQKMLDSLK